MRVESPGDWVRTTAQSVFYMACGEISDYEERIFLCVIIGLIHWSCAICMGDGGIGTPRLLLAWMAAAPIVLVLYNILVLIFLKKIICDTVRRKLSGTVVEVDEPVGLLKKSLFGNGVASGVVIARGGVVSVAHLVLVLLVTPEWGAAGLHFVDIASLGPLVMLWSTSLLLRHVRWQLDRSLEPGLVKIKMSMFRPT